MMPNGAVKPKEGEGVEGVCVQEERAEKERVQKSKRSVRC